jgi:hypothetical protein
MKKLLLSITIAATMLACNKSKEVPGPIALSCFEKTTKDYLEAYKVFAGDPTNLDKCKALVAAARKVVECPDMPAESRKQFEEAAKNACVQ